jgi:hypothetical protein
MAIKDSVAFTNLLSFDDDPDWVVRRYPFTDGAGGNLVNMKPGYLVKFGAAAADVLGALGADDAALAGIIVDLPDATDVPSGANTKTVAVALSGSFNKNQVKYADGSTPISAAGLDPATPAGNFAP